MTDQDVPSSAEPQTTGVEAAQRSASPEEAKTLVKVHRSDSIGEFHVSEALKPILAATAREQFLLFFVKGLEADLAEARAELRELQRRLEESQRDCHEAEKQVVQLRERSRGDSRNRYLRGVFKAAGTLIIGVAATFLPQSPLIASLAVVVGICLEVVGWWQPAAEREEGSTK